MVVVFPSGCVPGSCVPGKNLLILSKKATSRRLRIGGPVTQTPETYRRGEAKLYFNPTAQYRHADFDFIEVPKPEPCGANFIAAPQPFSFNYTVECENEFDIAIEDEADTGGQQHTWIPLFGY